MRKSSQNVKEFSINTRILDSICLGGKSGGILYLWKNSFGSVDLKWKSSQAIHCTIITNPTKSFILSIVYASTNCKCRRLLWGELKEIGDLNVPHIITGDFNCITSPKFKKCGKSFEWGPGEFDLINLKNDCGLIDLSFSGEAFTWCNN